VQELHEKLESLEYGLKCHWVRSGLAKTGSAGMAIGSAVCFATGVGAVAGFALGAASAATGVGATVGDFFHDRWTTGGLQAAYERADQALIEAACQDPTLFFKIYAAIGNAVTLKAALVDFGAGVYSTAKLVEVAEAARKSGDVVRVGSIFSEVLGVGHGGTRIMTAAAAANSGAVAAEGARAGAVVVGQTLCTFSILGAVASSGIAIHSWATNPPSYEDVKSKRIEIGKLLETL